MWRLNKTHKYSLQNMWIYCKLNDFCVERKTKKKPFRKLTK